MSVPLCVCGHLDGNHAQPYDVCRAMIGTRSDGTRLYCSCAVFRPAATPEAPPAGREHTIWICDACLNLRGEMCSEPRCIFCRWEMNEVGACLEALLIRPVINGERLPPPEAPPRKPGEWVAYADHLRIVAASEAARAAAEKERDAARARVAELEEWLRDDADEPCGYGDGCPTFGTHHGTCRPCRARAALGAKDEGGGT